MMKDIKVGKVYAYGSQFPLFIYHIIKNSKTLNNFFWTKRKFGY